MRVAQMGMTFTGAAEDFIQEVESSFFKLTNDAKTGGMMHLRSALKSNLKELEDTTRQLGEISGLSTGYRPAMGKTSLA